MSSSIEWTDETWNPVVGCAKVSEGCRNCYAMKEAHRLAGNPNPKICSVYEGLTRNVTGKGPQWTGKVRLVSDRLGQPLRWKKARRVFVNSMSDLFHPDVPDEFIMSVFGVMAACPQHVFQILTKRPERARHILGTLTDLIPGGATNLEDLEGAHGVWPPNECMAWAEVYGGLDLPQEPATRWPLRNVWLGTSVEDQESAKERIPPLLQTPASIRWLSCEPLLGPVDLDKWIRLANRGMVENIREANALGAFRCREAWALHWVVVGGESGRGARPFDLAWGRSLIEQCRTAGVPVFMKQLGASPREVRSTPCSFWPKSQTEFRVRLSSKKGSDPSEWPEDLRVREWPR